MERRSRENGNAGPRATAAWAKALAAAAVIMVIATMDATMASRPPGQHQSWLAHPDQWEHWKNPEGATADWAAGHQASGPVDAGWLRERVKGRTRWTVSRPEMRNGKYEARAIAILRTDLPNGETLEAALPWTLEIDRESSRITRVSPDYAAGTVERKSGEG